MIAFVAPRGLNDPVFCMFSHLKNNFLPLSSSKAEEVRTGVKCTCGLILSLAAFRSDKDSLNGGEVILSWMEEANTEMMSWMLNMLIIMSLDCSLGRFVAPELPIHTHLCQILLVVTMGM